MRRLLLALLLSIGMLPARPALAVELGQGALGNIFVEGEAVAIPVHAAEAPLRWRVRDFFGTEVASGTAEPAGGTAVLRPRIEGLGYFTLDVSAERAGQSLGTAETALAIVPRPKPAAAASPFGVMTHFAKGWQTDIIPLIEKAGLHRVRDEQPWRQVEKERGRYEFPPRLSAYMAALTAHHIDPLLVLAFANPLYDDGKTPFSDAGRAGYAAYARAVAQHYGPGLGAVEIWNEYNGSFCEGPCKSDRPGFYAAMLQQADKALKAADPRLTVLGGAAVPIPLDYFRGLFDKGALGAMDAIVIHPYRPQPEGVERDIEALRQLMAKYGTPKPIWATEFGDLADMKKSRDDVARYLVRMSTLLLSAKVERIYWYLLRDFQEFTGLGLLRDENDPLGRYAPTPAYVAYATLIHQLEGLSFVRREASDPRTRIYLFASGGEEIRVAWSALPGTSFDVASSAPVRVSTMMGGVKTLPPQDGRVAIPLGQDPIYVLGKVVPVEDRHGDGPAASSMDDFSLEQGAKGWSYGMIVRPDGPIAVGMRFGEPFEALQQNQTQGGWMHPASPTLKIKAGMMHPGRARKAAAWAVRRWTSPAGGALRVTGTVQANDKKSEGVSFAVLVAGRAVYVAELVGAGALRKADFDLPVTLEPGATIDFAVGPGPGGSIDFDATGLTAFISAAPKP